METNRALENLLRRTLSVDASDIKSPDLSTLSEARNKIMLRKKADHELNDYLSAFATFLNLKIKLYHAVLACLIIGAVIFYTTRKENAPSTPESLYTQHTSNIASVRNSTVLCSIETFAVKN